MSDEDIKKELEELAFHEQCMDRTQRVMDIYKLERYIQEEHPNRKKYMVFPFVKKSVDKEKKSA